MTDAFDFDRYDHIRPIRWTGDTLELLVNGLLHAGQHERAAHWSAVLKGMGTPAAARQ